MTITVRPPGPALVAPEPQHSKVPTSGEASAPPMSIDGVAQLPAPLRASAPGIPIPMPAAPSHVTSVNLAAMVTAEAAIADSGLEGGSPQDAARHMSQTLQSLGSGRWTDLASSNPQVTAMSEHFGSLADLAALQSKHAGVASSPRTFANTVAQKIRGLAEGKSLLVPGGWRSGYAGNHAMVYRIEREAGNPLRYGLTVYNAGSGVQYHHGVIEADGAKEKHQGVIRYAGVPAETFFVAGAASQWLEALCEPQIRRLRHGQAYNSEDIYEALLPQCGGTRVHLEPEVARYFTMQRSGSCSWSVLMAVMTDMLETRVYKALKLEVEGATLLGFHAHVSTLKSPAPQNFYVLRKALQNLKGAAAKLVDRGDLSPVNRAALIEALQPIDATVARMDALAPAPFAAVWPQIDGAPTFEMKLPPLPREPQGAAIGFVSAAQTISGRRSAALAPKTEVFIEPPELATQAAMPLAGRLQAWAAYAQNCIDAGASHTAIPLLDAAIATLPVPTRGGATDAHWDAVEALPTLDALTELFDVYFTAAALWDARRDGPQVLSLFSLAACIDKVARRVLDTPDINLPWRSLLSAAFASPGDALPLSDLPRFRALHDLFPISADEAPSLEMPKHGSWEHELLLRALDNRDDGSGSDANAAEVNLFDRDLLAERLAPLLEDLGKGGQLRGDMRAFGLLRRTYFLMQSFANPPSQGFFSCLPPFGSIEPKLVAQKQEGGKALDVSFELSLGGRNPPRLASRVADTQRMPALSRVARMHFAGGTMSENEALTIVAGGANAAEVHRLSVMGTYHSVRLPLALTYYQDHLDKLAAPEARAELQACLRSKSSNLNNALPAVFTEPALMEQLATLLTCGFDRFGRMERDLPTTLFFARTIAEVRDAANALGWNINLPNPRPVLYDLTEFGNLDDGERSAVWLALVATTDVNRALGDDSVLQAMLKCSANGRLHAIPLSLQDDDMSERANANMLAVRNRVATCFDDLEFCRDMVTWGVGLLRSLGLTVDAKTQWEAGFPNIYYGELELDVTTGELTNNGAPFAVGLPNMVRDLPAYKALLGDRIPTARFENGAYQVGDDLRIQLGANIVFRKRFVHEGNDVWLTYRETQSFSTDLPPAIRREHLIFQAEVGVAPALILTDKQGTPRYEGRQVGAGIDLMALTGSAAGAHLAPISALPQALKAFEDERAIHLWQRDGKNERLELPRYGLSFEFDAEGRARESLGGFWLSLERPVGFRRYTGALMLQNALGVRKMLLPLSDLAKSGAFETNDTALPLKTQVPSPHPVTTFEAAQYKSVDIDGEGLLTSKDPTTCLQLAYVYASEGDFPAAVRQARQARAFAPWPADAWPVLTRLLARSSNIRTGDPDSLALFGVLTVGLAATLRGAPLPGRDNWRPTLENHFIKYLGSIGNVDIALRLSPYEERQALTLLTQNKLFTQNHLEMRLRYLQGHETSAQGSKVQQFNERDQAGNTLLDTDFAAALEPGSRVDIDDLPILHPGPLFLRAFTSMLEVASSADADERSRLAQRLRMMGPAEPPSNHFLRRCLLAVIDHPELGTAWLTAPELDSQASLRTRRQAYTEKLNAARTILYRSTQAGSFFTPARPLLSTPPTSVSPVARVTGQVSQGIQKGPVERPLQTLGWAVRQQAPANTAGTDISAWPQDAAGVLGEQARAVVTNIEAYQQTRAPTLSLAQDAFPRLRAEVFAARLPDSIGAAKTELERIANDVAAQDADPNLLRLQVASKRVARISFGNLQTAFARRDMESLRQQNPWLSDTDVETLETQMRELLLEVSRQQHLDRVWACIERLDAAKLQSPHGPRVDALSQELATIIASTRTYDVNAQPELLVFECSADILLRPSQVDTIERLQEVDDNGDFRQLVQQLNMGEGKTKVLLPLLALKKADGKRLPMVVVPQELFDVNRQDLTATSQMHFGQTCQPFIFDRESPTDLSSLLHLSRMMNDVKEQRQYVLTTRESVQSFRHQYLTLLTSLNQGSASLDPTLLHRVSVMEEVLTTWKKDGHVHLDEADQILDIKKELIYSHGAAQKVDAEAADLVADIMEHLATDPVLSQRVRLRENKQNLLSAKDYSDHVAGPLASTLLDTHPLLKQLQDVCPRDQLVAYVLAATGQPPISVRELAGGSSGEARDLLALLKEEITNILPLTLSRSNLEDYGPLITDGMSAADVLPNPAIPYNKTKPLVKSRFGVIETLNCTLQDLLQRGPQVGEIYAFTEKLRTELMIEMQQDSIPMSETKAAKLFSTVVAGTPLADVTLADIDSITEVRLIELAQILHDDPRRMRIYARHMVYPTVEQYTQQLSSNAHDFVDVFACVQGFSGTLWNASTFASRLEIERQPEADGSTAQAFFDADITTVEPIADVSIKNLLCDLQGQPVDRAHALIDTGALLKHLSNLEVAQHLAEHFGALPDTGIRGILHFDAASNQLAVLDVQSGGILHLDGTDAKAVAAAGLDPRSLFAYYDQAHTTGTDLPLPDDATGVLTVAASIRLRDAQQSAMRLRQLMSGQRLVVRVPRDVIEAKAWRAHNVSMREICTLALTNQATQLGADKVRALKLGLQNAAHQMAFDACLQTPVSRKGLVFEALKPLLVDSQEGSFYQQFGAAEETETQTALHAYEIRLAQRILSCAAALPAPSRGVAADLIKLSQQIDSGAMRQRLSARVGQLPARSRRSGGERTDTEQQVQQEAQAELNQERMTESQRDTLRGVTFRRETYFDAAQLYVPGSLLAGHLRPINEALNASIFDPTVWGTANFISTVQGTSHTLLTAHAKPAYFFVALEEPTGERRFVAISAGETHAVLTRLGESVNGEARKVSLFNQQGKLVKQGKPGCSNAVMQDESFQRAVVQFKALTRAHTGELHVTQAQRRIYDLWMQAGNEPERRARRRLLQTM